MDVDKRRIIMKAIHSNNTSIEIMLRRELWKYGVRYRIHKKIRRNIERDLEQTILLRDEGWTVFRFWGTDIQNDVKRCSEIIIKCISRIKQQKHDKNFRRKAQEQKQKVIS